MQFVVDSILIPWLCGFDADVGLICKHMTNKKINKSYILIFKTGNFHFFTSWVLKLQSFLSFPFSPPFLYLYFITPSSPRPKQLVRPLSLINYKWGVGVSWQSRVPRLQSSWLHVGFSANTAVLAKLQTIHPERRVLKLKYAKSFEGRTESFMAVLVVKGNHFYCHSALCLRKKTTASW